VRVQQAVGLALLVQAIVVATMIIGSMESLRASSAAFSYPSDPALTYYGMLMLNALLVVAPAALGIYLIRSVSPSVALVILLAVVSALYGGLGIVLPLFALGICIWQKKRRVQSN
jgi:hypothetical protein